MCVCVCVACRARATGRWEGGVRMSGGICVCVCEGNHHSSHQCARPASIFAITPRPRSHLAALWGGASGHRSPVVRGLQQRQVLILSQEGFPSSNIRAKKKKKSSSFHFFFFILHQQSWVLAADASLSKRAETIFDISHAPLSTETRGNSGS